MPVDEPELNGTRNDKHHQHTLYEPMLWGVPVSPRLTFSPGSLRWPALRIVTRRRRLTVTRSRLA